MSEQQELQAKTAIVHAMRPQERLASFYRSRKSKSMYLILANDAGDYLPIRISNHRAFSGFFKCSDIWTVPCNTVRNRYAPI